MEKTELKPKKRLFRFIIDVFEDKKCAVVKLSCDKIKTDVSILKVLGALRIAELELLESESIADCVMENDAKN